jgi:hypothetical protein
MAANPRRHEDAQQRAGEIRPVATEFAFIILITGYFYYQAAVMTTFLGLRPSRRARAISLSRPSGGEVHEYARTNVDYRAQLTRSIALGFHGMGTGRFARAL